jgi:hypothetical protein
MLISGRGLVVEFMCPSGRGLVVDSYVPFW